MFFAVKPTAPGGLLKAGVWTLSYWVRATSGVVVGAARPMKTLTELSPESAVHKLPEGSTATSTGVFNEPSDAATEVPVEAANCERPPAAVLFVTQIVPALSTATPAGWLSTP